MQPVEVIAEGQRIFTICNACRYCEGYCAVFPAMERRLTFAAGDLRYLANLCHDCGECYTACQYAPPHEYAVNVPQTLAALRGQSWRRYAWPGGLARLFDGAAAATTLVVALAIGFFAAFAYGGSGAAEAARAPGDFYAVLPHPFMAWTFALAGLFTVAVLLVGFVRCARDTGEHPHALLAPAALREALGAALSLRYLHGGGAGCINPERELAGVRRVLHHLTAYGFLLCFAATVVATFYHYGLGLRAPYPYASVPVMLGVLGGIGLAIGPAGFLALRTRRDPDLADADQDGLNVRLNVLLLVTSVSGLALLAWREGTWMRPLLVAHLGIVLAFFLVLPYGKLVHAVYRLAALAKHAAERRRPHAGLGGG